MLHCLSRRSLLWHPIRVPAFLQIACAMRSGLAAAIRATFSGFPRTELPHCRSTGSNPTQGITCLRLVFGYPRNRPINVMALASPIPQKDNSLPKAHEVSSASRLARFSQFSSTPFCVREHPLLLSIVGHECCLPNRSQYSSRGTSIILSGVERSCRWLSPLLSRAHGLQPSPTVRHLQSGTGNVTT
jgi:hypothetical protein